MALRKRVGNSVDRLLKDGAVGVDSVETTQGSVYTCEGLVCSVAAAPCSDTFGIGQGVVGM